MPKAYSYIRFSSAEQRKGDSHRRQLERSQNYANEHKLELVSEAEYSFLDEGRSGFSGEHVSADGELARFLGKIKDGSIPKGSFLLIESFDRLSRESLNIALPRFIDILNSDITVVTLMDGRVYTKDFNQLDLFYSIMLMGTAHEESAKKSDRIGASWKNKQRLAAEQLIPMSKIAPNWLTLENNQYKPIPERVEVVKEIFHLVTNGYGGDAICRMFNERKIPIFGTAARNKRGIWGVSIIRKIIHSRAVLGEYQPYTFNKVTKKREPAGEPIKNYYPAIISEELFYLAQDSTNQRRTSRATKQSKDFNLYSKIAVCAKCGSPMHKISKGKPPKGGTYLVCSDAKRGACEYHTLRLVYAETLFKEILAKVDSLSLVQSNQEKLTKDLSIIQARIAEKKSNLDKQIEIHKKFPSESSAKMLQEGEKELSGLKIIEADLFEKIATDKITSKEDFFIKLDLSTYEGRYKANSLLQRLKASVVFEFPELRKHRNELLRIKSQFSKMYPDDSSALFSYAFLLSPCKATLTINDEVNTVFYITADGDIFPYAKSLNANITSFLQGDNPKLQQSEAPDVSLDALKDIFIQGLIDADEHTFGLAVARGVQVRKAIKIKDNIKKGKKRVLKVLPNGYRGYGWE